VKGREAVRWGGGLNLKGIPPGLGGQKNRGTHKGGLKIVRTTSNRDRKNQGGGPQKILYEKVRGSELKHLLSEGRFNNWGSGRKKAFISVRKDT